ncbi:MAG TPA: hypothetical protein VN081_01235 [Dongiaceae bacterium]|nr:hypothetical protein [Dongiaceae bacterium]
MNKPTQPEKPIAPKHRETMIRDMGIAVAKMNQEAAILPEPVFVEHILPLIAGSIDGRPVDLDLWTSLAGCTFRGFDVTNPNTGEVLYRCPPIHRTLPSGMGARTVRTSQFNLSEITKNAMNISQNAPRKARQFLDESLSRKVPHVGIDIDRAMAYDTILKRYGYPGLGLPDSVMNVTTGKPGTSGSKTPAEDKPAIENFGDFDF